MSITIQPYKNEKVIIDGRSPIRGFTSSGPNQYVASVHLRSDDTNQIFFDDVPGHEAQWPNSSDPLHPAWATIGAGSNDSLLVDPNLPKNLTGWGYIKFWSGEDAWSAATATFTSPQAGSIPFLLDAKPQESWIVPEPGGLYYLFGNRALLDAPFEWYYDDAAQKLYVQIPSGKAITDYKISYKARNYGIDLSDMGQVTVRNINLFATTIAMNAMSYNNVIDGIHADYVSQVSRLRDRDVHPWVGGFEVDHVFDTGIMLKGRQNTLKNSVITHSACNGVVVTGDGNTVTNNSISSVGSFFNDCSGIYVVGTNHSITHNAIHDTGRDAILLSFTWNPQDNDHSSSPTNIDISYNDLYDFGLLGDDVGGIYMNGQTLTGVKIHHNWIHDALYPNPLPHSTLVPRPTTVAIYLDNNTSDVEAFQNVLSNLQLFPVLINTGTTTHVGPNNNSIHNNTIINPAAGGSIQILGPMPDCGTTSLVDNKVTAPMDEATTKACKSSNNSPTAVGANELKRPSVGCSLKECSVDPYEWPAA